ncbi:MAG TPA: helix-turn-helix domain-containing protein [Gammaproteobacteria bacterium]|nr:helix-turn-helix domain-containing protein [Gammaproteobacteria bacterium]
MGTPQTDIRQRIGQRIRQLREASGLNQTQVAESLGVTRQTLARMERGEVPIDSEVLFRLASRFDRPVSHFYEERDGEGVRLALRADQPHLLTTGLQNRLLDRLAAIADLEVAAGLGIQHGLPPTEPLLKAGERELAIVQEVAQEERGRLGLGPVAAFSDPVAVLESLDIRVIPFELEPGEDGELLSGFSAFSETLGAGIFVNTHPRISVEHQVFSLMHEYAHLIFHRRSYQSPSAPYRTRGRGASPAEKIANTFAGHMLVPPAGLRRFVGSLGALTLTDIFEIKRIYRVSFAAVLTRLQQDSLIGKKAAGTMWGIWKRRRWQTEEPEPVREPLCFYRRTVRVARRAFERGEVTQDFLADILELGRKEVAVLLMQWEEEALTNAVQ